MMISARGCLSLVAACLAATSRATATLVAYYSFDDGTAAEDSDSSLDGTISGAWASTGPDGSGALSFDGGESYVQFPDALTSGILGSNARTVCLWAAISSFNDAALFTFGDYADGEEFALMTAASAGEFIVQLYGGDYDTDVSVSEWSDDDGWHHYCLVYDGADWSLYVDGAVAHTATASLNTGSENPLTIGVRDNESYLGGSVDELYVYSSALSESEIQVREENDMWWKLASGDLRDWHDRTLFKEPPYYLISLVSVACILFLNPAVRGCIIKQSMIMLGLVVCGFPTPSTVEAVLLKMNDHVPGIMPVLLAWFLMVLTLLITIAAFKVRSWLTFVRRTAGKASRHVVERLSATGSSAGVSLFTDDDGKHDARFAGDWDEEAKIRDVVLQFDEPALGPPPPLVPCPPPGRRDDPEVEHFLKSDEAKSASEESSPSLFCRGDGLEIDCTGDSTDVVGAFVVRDKENVAAVLEKAFDDGTVEEVDDIGALRLRQTLSTHHSVASLTSAHDFAYDEEDHHGELMMVKRCLRMVEKPKITAALVYAKPGYFDREGPSSPTGSAAGSPKTSRMQSRLTASAKGQWSKAMGEFRKILFPQ